MKTRHVGNTATRLRAKNTHICYTARVAALDKDLEVISKQSMSGQHIGISRNRNRVQRCRLPETACIGKSVLNDMSVAVL